MQPTERKSVTVRPLIVVLALLAAVTGAGCASAQAKATKEMEELNRAALADMKKGRPKAAQQKLTQALQAGEEAELGADPLMARTHLSLGAVYAGPLKNRDKGSEHMRKALELNPKARLTASFASPAARQALASVRAERRSAARKPPAEAVAEVKAEAEAKAETPKPEPAKPEAAPPEPKEEAEVAAEPVVRKGREPQVPSNFATPLFCPSPPDSPPEEEVVVRCAAAPGTRPGRLSLYYRPAGSESFTEVPMARSKKGWYTGVVPATATTTKSVQYYVEGRGTPKLASGQPDSPNLVLVREDADEPLGEDDEPGEDNPLAEIERARGREHLRLRPPGKIWAALGLGTSYGWQPGGALEFRKEQEVASGMLGGGLVTVLPEVGYQLSERVAVSLQARLQYLPTEGSGDRTQGSPATRAFAALVRGTYSMGADNLRPFISLVAGGGDGFRLKVPPSREAELVRSDTVKGGPLVGGGGVGAIFHYSPHLAFSGELRGLVGAPSIAAVAELSVGAELAF